MNTFARENLLDHYNHPRHKGTLADADAQAHDVNPFCGDEVTIMLRVAEGHVSEAAFEGRGCTISQATASMLMEEIVGQPVDEITAWGREFVLDLLGIEISAARLKCALLPLNVIHQSLHQAEEQETNAK